MRKVSQVMSKPLIYSKLPRTSKQRFLIDILLKFKLFILFIKFMKAGEATGRREVMNPRQRKQGLKERLKEIQQREKAKVKMNSSKYEAIGKIGEGVSSIVFLAKNRLTGETVAIKKIKNFLENKHESLRILREILLLKKLKHPNIINLKEILIQDQSCKDLSLVLQYLPSDVKKILKSVEILDIQRIKLIIYQMLLGLNYLHQSQVLHRDLKPENILINKDLTEVKLCDFGLARAVEMDQDRQNEEKQMKNEDQENKKTAIQEQKQNKIQKVEKSSQFLTVHVSTRWYRAPELILLQRHYNNAIDIWSVGCIMGQLLTMLHNFGQRRPLFPGKACYPLSPPKTPDMSYKKINDFPHWVNDQLSVIFSIIGTPKDIDFISDERAKNYIRSFGYCDRKPFSKILQINSPQIEDFLERALQFNPNVRMTIKEALNHKLFDDIRPMFEQNQRIKGSPIGMEQQGLQLEDIRKLVVEEYKYYQSLQ